MKRPDRAGQRGFSLLEVLVAFGIMALALGVLLRIFGGGGRLASLSGEHAEAALIAESVLARAGIEKPLLPGVSSGEVSEIYRWTLSVTPFVAEGVEIPQELPFKALWLEATVQWGEDSELHEFSLQTLRLVSVNQQPGGFNP